MAKDKNTDEDYQKKFTVLCKKTKQSIGNLIDYFDENNINDELKIKLEELQTELEELAS